jgi:hypothetical protein
MPLAQARELFRTRQARDASPTPSYASSARSTFMVRAAQDWPRVPGVLMSLPSGARRRRFRSQHSSTGTAADEPDVRSGMRAQRAFPAIMPSAALQAGAEAPPAYTLPARHNRRSPTPVEVQPRRAASQLLAPPPTDYDYLREVHERRRPLSEAGALGMKAPEKALPACDEETGLASESRAVRVVLPEIITLVFMGEKVYARPGASYEVRRPLCARSDSHVHVTAGRARRSTRRISCSAEDPPDAPRFAHRLRARCSRRRRAE